MNIEVGRFSKRVLLTGAGFSKNWGGYLADEFWERLLGSPLVQDRPVLKAALKGDMDFESVVHRARTDGAFNRADKQALELAVHQVYESLDRQIRLAKSWEPNGDRFHEFIRMFLGPFDGTPEEGYKLRYSTGYVFTLNQDLLLERRFFEPRQAPKPTLPGILSQGERWFTSDFFQSRLQPNDSIPVETATDDPVDGWPSLEGQLNYVKLHGSWNWRTADGSDVMVIGGGKSELIERSPLLRWYQNIFRAVCSVGDVRLLVIGYSFGDKHINDIILECAHKYGLQLYVMQPTGAKSWQHRLRLNKFQGQDIWNIVSGYFTRAFGDGMNDGHVEPEELRRLRTEFFGDEWESHLKMSGLYGLE